MTPTEAQAKQFLAQLETNVQFGAAWSAAHHGGNQEAFRWARRDRRTQHFQPHPRSADAAISESDYLMHARTRSESLNNAQIKRIRDAIEDLLVGSGMQTFADPFDPLLDITDLSEETLDPLIQYALESDEVFEDWFCDEKQFDAAGKRSGPDIQRMMAGECVERGACLLVRTARREPGRIVPLCYQVIESDQLDRMQDRPRADGQNKIVGGIELDAMDREVAFHIYDDHPYDDFLAGNISGKSSRVSAERVIHACLFKRPSQSIGATWLSALGQTSFDRDGALGSELQTFKKAALLLLIHYAENLKNGGNLGLYDDTPDTDTFGNEELKMGSTPLAIRVQAKDEVELVENQRPTASADAFINILDHDIAGAAGLSYYTMSGRYDQTNYTSVRGSLLSEDSHFKPLQNWFAGKVALPVRREFHRQAIGLGKLKSVTAAKFLANPKRFERFDAIGAGRDLLDPEAETNAATGKLRSCLTTLKQECARRGLHWIRVLRQIALENRLLDVLGISMDLSKGQGGQVSGNTRSKRDQKDAQESGGKRTKATLKTGGQPVKRRRRRGVKGGSR